MANPVDSAKFNVGDLYRNAPEIKSGSLADLALQHMGCTCSMNKDIKAIGALALGGQKQGGAAIVPDLTATTERTV